MKPLVKGTAGALEVDAEGIATPADQGEYTGWTGCTSSPSKTGWTDRTYKLSCLLRYCLPS